MVHAYLHGAYIFTSIILKSRIILKHNKAFFFWLEMCAK